MFLGPLQVAYISVGWLPDV